LASKLIVLAADNYKVISCVVALEVNGRVLLLFKEEVD
jgi:hypothetical protein